MQDINYQLRQSYYSLLAGNIFINNQVVPVCYLQAPAGTPATPVPNCYIIFNPPFGSGFKDFDRDHTLTSFNLLIVTKYPNNNSGSDADNIAGQIYAIIQPNPRAKVVQITNGEVIDTRTTQDRVFGNLTDGLNKVVNRAITFTHKIMHYPQSATTGNVFYFIQDTTDDPTDWTHSLQVNPASAISVPYGMVNAAKVYGLAIPNIVPVKTDYQDVNDTGNSGKIGSATDLFAMRLIMHLGIQYQFYYTQYLTGFNGPEQGVRFS